jgi:16S rRNA (adenine1518-N6/adenine1519-N6)-dimethyltransferase
MIAPKSIKDIQSLLQNLGTEPQFALGQNFLVDEHAVNSIISAVYTKNKNPPKNLYEIGPGLGALTEELLDQKLTPLILIELDKIFAKYWESRGQKVIQVDALSLNWDQYTDSEEWNLVSNLPYQIASSLVIELGNLQNPPRSMVLMFQKEVAERFMAKPSSPEYGILSVIGQTLWSIEKVCDAGPASFWPKPKIASRVLKFTWNNWESRPLRLKLLFAQRRKQIHRPLISWLGGQISQDTLISMGLTLKERAEELSPEIFQSIVLTHAHNRREP